MSLKDINLYTCLTLNSAYVVKEDYSRSKAGLEFSVRPWFSIEALRFEEASGVREAEIGFTSAALHVFD